MKVIFSFVWKKYFESIYRQNFPLNFGKPKPDRVFELLFFWGHHVTSEVAMCSHLLAAVYIRKEKNFRLVECLLNARKGFVVFICTIARDCNYLKLNFNQESSLKKEFTIKIKFHKNKKVSNGWIANGYIPFVAIKLICSQDILPNLFIFIPYNLIINNTFHTDPNILYKSL